MKKLKYKFLAFAITVLLVSCSTEDKIVDIVNNGVERGAILRTLETISDSFDISDPASSWSVKIEEQDDEGGALLEKVDVYVSFSDKTEDGSDFSKAEKLLKTINASEFTPSDVNLPSTTVSSTLSDVTTLLGLNSSEYNANDEFTFRLSVVLTDGRSYTDADASGNIASGSFFKSPYKYTVGFED